MLACVAHNCCSRHSSICRPSPIYSSTEGDGTWERLQPSHLAPITHNLSAEKRSEHAFQKQFRLDNRLLCCSALLELRMCVVRTNYRANKHRKILYSFVHHTTCCVVHLLNQLETSFPHANTHTHIHTAAQYLHSSSSHMRTPNLPHLLWS